MSVEHVTKERLRKGKKWGKQVFREISGKI